MFLFRILKQQTTLDEMMIIRYYYHVVALLNYSLLAFPSTKQTLTG